MVGVLGGGISLQPTCPMVWDGNSGARDTEQ